MPAPAMRLATPAPAVPSRSSYVGCDVAHPRKNRAGDTRLPWRALKLTLTGFFGAVRDLTGPRETTSGACIVEILRRIHLIAGQPGIYKRKEYVLTRRINSIGAWSVFPG